MKAAVNSTVTMFLLPQDSVPGQAAVTALLSEAQEVWCAMYALTDPWYTSQITRLDGLGIPTHHLLDATQSTTPAEAALLPGWRASLQHGDVTFSTAGPASSRPGAIMHMKTLVVRRAPRADGVWSGSVNFSGSGWYQANTAALFYNNQWSRTAFIPWFEQTRTWALARVPQDHAKLRAWLAGPYYQDEWEQA